MTRKQPVPEPVNPTHCRAGSASRQIASFDAVLSDYLSEYAGNAADEWEFYARRRLRSEAIRMAGLAIWDDDGHRHPHQYRLSKATLRRCWAKLRKCRFESCRTFDDLFEMVQTAIRGIHGVGELMVYDTAYRIGAHLGKRPTKVYLHAGTRKGAKALGLGRGRKWLAKKELPPAFRKLPASDIENCLCIYADELKKIARRKQ